MRTKFLESIQRFLRAASFSAFLLLAFLAFAPCLASENHRNDRQKEKTVKSTVKTPEQVVSALFKALKEGGWEQAVSYIDIKGMIDEAKTFLNRASDQLTAAEKEKLQAELDGLTEEKVRESFIGNMKEVFGNDFSFTITGISMRDENRAVVFVELSRNGKSKNDSIPLTKISGKWLVSYRGLVKFTPTETK